MIEVPVTYVGSAPLAVLKVMVAKPARSTAAIKTEAAAAGTDLTTTKLTAILGSLVKLGLVSPVPGSPKKWKITPAGQKVVTHA